MTQSVVRGMSGCTRRSGLSELDVLVVDAASHDELTARRAAVLPRAFILRESEARGFSAAANEALLAVEGASHLLVCHDDVAPAPDRSGAWWGEAYDPTPASSARSWSSGTPRTVCSSRPRRRPLRRCRRARRGRRARPGSARRVRRYSPCRAAARSCGRSLQGTRGFDPISTCSARTSICAGAPKSPGLGRGGTCRRVRHLGLAARARGGTSTWPRFAGATSCAPC